jgi:hypothetical protein
MLSALSLSAQSHDLVPNLVPRTTLLSDRCPVSPSNRAYGSNRDAQLRRLARLDRAYLRVSTMSPRRPMHQHSGGACAETSSLREAVGIDSGALLPLRSRRRNRTSASGAKALRSFSTNLRPSASRSSDLLRSYIHGRGSGGIQLFGHRRDWKWKLGPTFVLWVCAYLESRS